MVNSIAELDIMTKLDLGVMLQGTAWVSAWFDGVVSGNWHEAVTQGLVVVAVQLWGQTIWVGGET